MFYYTTNPLKGHVTTSTGAFMDAHCVLCCLPEPRPSNLTEYIYNESFPYCPVCMHDSCLAPYCGGSVCATIQHELDVELEWHAGADASDTSDGEHVQIDDRDDVIC